MSKQVSSQDNHKPDEIVEEPPLKRQKIDTEAIKKNEDTTADLAEEDSQDFEPSESDDESNEAELEEENDAED